MEKLDLTVLLRDCPKGTKLYSPLFGEVELEAVTKVHTFPIEVRVGKRENFAEFTSNGRFFADHENSECMLFPSKDNRDWSTFKVEQTQPQFKPFEKVLVRNHDGQAWKTSLYSYLRKGWANPHVCIEDCYNQCIPYEGNEHLLGTNDEPK